MSRDVHSQYYGETRNLSTYDAERQAEVQYFQFLFSLVRGRHISIRRSLRHIHSRMGARF